jgi:hypothetical protein
LKEEFAKKLFKRALKKNLSGIQLHEALLKMGISIPANSKTSLKVNKSITLT